MFRTFVKGVCSPLTQEQQETDNTSVSACTVSEGGLVLCFDNEADGGKTQQKQTSEVSQAMWFGGYVAHPA